MANWAELDDLLAECDAIFVCCSLTESSRHLLDAAALSLVRPDAIFVSIAPNDVFDLADLAEWLCQRPNAAAVLDLDPLPPGHALRTCPNARVTPHLAFRTEATLRRRVEAAIDLVERAISNQPVALLLDPANDAAPPARRWDSPTLRARDQFLECAYSFLYPQALYALIKLGVLSCLAKGPRSAEGLARELGLQLGPLELLLSAGCSADYLRRSNSGGFELAPMLRGLKGSVDLAPLVVSAVEGCYAAAAGLGDYVRSGVPATRLQDLRNGSDSWSETLTRGSHAVSAPIADALSTRLEGGVGRILDLGAGPASLTRRLLQRNPATSAVLIDTASVLEFTARTYLGPEGLLSRCTLQPGDITSPDPLPAAQDLIIMSNVIHVLDPGENLAVFRRARKALSPDGRLVLLSFLTGSEGPRFNAHFALLCQAVSGSARGYESREVGEMLREAGFRLEADLTLGAFSTAIVARPDTR
jgi:SAM-dependent methyltransferase